MGIDKVLAAMTPEIYQKLVTAVELGKWADGTPLTEEQKANSLQAVMLWQAHHNHEPEHMSVGTDGQIVIKSKQELKQIFASEQRISVQSVSDEE